MSMINLKLKLTLLVLSSISILACQSTPVSGVSSSAQSLIQALANQAQAKVFRASYQSPSQAAFQVSLVAKQNSFQTQNSQAGQAAKDFTDVSAFRVFLVSSATAPSGTITPFNSNVYTINTPTAAQTLIFDNVPAGSYYACATAFDSTTTFNTSTNLADKQTQTLDYSEGKVACSSAGGEGGSPGRVTIDANYQVTGTASLQINLTLQKAIGANIGSNITVNNG